MISCSQYDYLEIACMYKLAIKLVLTDGSIVEGTAFDTGYNSDKQEVIVLKIANELTKIPTETLASITALTANPHFNHIDFQ
ncbi:Rho-binding antiterminator [Vibrio intestinalis]|uniref:Rho-binding antiterminator n=1 Tax=Vibrio intestinalis TaxID=2933291 RepID=UPI0021A8E0CD|nr:Rho-binding antiterminator [Vibrio intestinalis]